MSIIRINIKALGAMEVGFSFNPSPVLSIVSLEEIHGHVAGSFPKHIADVMYKARRIVPTIDLNTAYKEFDLLIKVSAQEYVRITTPYVIDLEVAAARIRADHPLSVDDIKIDLDNLRALLELKGVI